MRGCTPPPRFGLKPSGEPLLLVCRKWIAITGQPAGAFGGNEKRVDELAARASTTVITVPYGFAFFPHEIFWPPKSFIERSYTDIRRYEIMPRGGHFAAWEQPELMVEQIKAFFLEDVDSPALCGIKAGRSRL